MGASRRSVALASAALAILGSALWSLIDDGGRSPVHAQALVSCGDNQLCDVHGQVVGVPAIGTTTVSSSPTLVSPMESASAPDESSPQFNRTYSFHLPGGFTVVFEAYWLYAGERYWGAEMTQSDGKRVFFDPDNPADRIIVPDVVRDLQGEYAQAQAADQAYLATNPDEYVDSNGTKWKRE